MQVHGQGLDMHLTGLYDMTLDRTVHEEEKNYFGAFHGQEQDRL